MLTPVVGGGMLLRAAALRSRARLADALAVRYCRNPVALAHAYAGVALAAADPPHPAPAREASGALRPPRLT
ncbi:MAG TPA: hypothetical protein VKH36_05095 [Acidimicrobiia bacterium]|nr:hypothetical protein [Acidimicrobiia bacterium]